MSMRFCLSALFLALLSCLPEGSLSTATKLPFQFLSKDSHLHHRSGSFRVIFKETSLSLTQGGKCRKCDKSCQSYETYTGKGRSFKACQSEIGVLIVGTHEWLVIPLLKRRGEKMGGPFIHHFYGHLAFNGSIPTDQKGKLQLKLRIVAVYDVGKNAPKLNETTDVTFHNMRKGHYGEKAVVDLTRGGLNVHFTMRISIDCSPGYFPAETCAHYTGCALSAPCVKGCSLSGQTTCDPECAADEGPCAGRSGHSTADAPSTLLVSLAIPLVLVTIAVSLLAGIVVCKLSKRLSVPRSNLDARLGITCSPDNDDQAFCVDDMDSEFGLPISPFGEKESHLVSHCAVYENASNDDPCWQAKFVAFNPGPGEPECFHRDGAF